MIGDSTRSAGDAHSEQRTTTRRTVLKTTAAATVAAAGLGAASSSAGAVQSGDLPELDLQGDSPDASAGVPEGVDELVLNVHGYLGHLASRSQAAELAGTLEANGYAEPVVAVTWPAGGLPWSAESAAAAAGADLADWLEDYLDRNPGTTIRVVGHSMGGIVTMNLLQAAEGRFTIATAAMIGAYVDEEAVCTGGQHERGVQNAAVDVHNYWSANDGVSGSKIGGQGTGCSTPDNYEDVEVTDSVDGHTSYKGSDGCVSRMIENFDATVDRDGDDGSGDDGTGDDGSGDDGTGDDDTGDDEGPSWLDDLFGGGLFGRLFGL